MFNNKIFILQILALIFTLQKCEAKLSVECVVDYLKFRYFDDVSYFSSVSSNTGNPSECTDNIRSQVESFYNDARTRFNKHVVKRAHTECILREIKTDAYENHRLAALAAEIKGVGLKFWKSGDKNKYIESNNNKATEIEENAYVKCHGQKKYAEFFDTYYDQNKNQQLANDDFDYCLRKYFADKNIIKPNQYGFTLNPKRIIATDSIKCNEIMRRTFEQMKLQLAADGGQECSVEKFAANGYFDEILKIQLLSKLTLTPAEKEAEKQNFVTKMIYLTDLIRSCPI